MGAPSLLSTLPCAFQGSEDCLFLSPLPSQGPCQVCPTPAPTHPPTHPGAHFTETENSPGELSLSRIRKAPKWFRFIRVSSASCREILPEYHLCREGTVSALGSAGPLALAPLSHFPHGEIEKRGSKSRLHSRGKKHPRQPVSATSYQARQTHTQDKQKPGSRTPPAHTPQPD